MEKTIKENSCEPRGCSFAIGCVAGWRGRAQSLNGVSAGQMSSPRTRGPIRRDVMVRVLPTALLSDHVVQRPFGVMGPRLRGDDARECGHSFAFSRRAAPEVCQEIPALSKSRAQGGRAPDAPRGLVCISSGRAHTSIQVTPESPGTPRAMALRLITCSPRRTGLSCHRHLALLLARLDTSVGVS